VLLGPSPAGARPVPRHHGDDAHSRAQEFNGGSPRVPSGTRVAHKTGQITGSSTTRRWCSRPAGRVRPVVLTRGSREEVARGHPGDLEAVWTWATGAA
jgi:hypothetical protein